MVGNWLCHIPTLHHYDRFPPGGKITGGNMLGNHDDMDVEEADDDDVGSFQQLWEEWQLKMQNFCIFSFMNIIACLDCLDCLKWFRCRWRRWSPSQERFTTAQKPRRFFSPGKCLQELPSSYHIYSFMRQNYLKRTQRWSKMTLDQNATVYIERMTQ